VKRKIFSGLLALVLALSLGLVTAVPVGANTTWYVYEGESIQAAIDAASPGDTIIVAAGTYVEQLTITKTLSLIGTDLPTLDVSGFVLAPPGGGFGIDVTAPDVVIEGFRFIGVPPASMTDFSSATNPTIRASKGADRLTVQDNVFDPPLTGWVYPAPAAMGKQALLITDGVDNVSFLNNTVNDYAFGLTGRGRDYGTDNITVEGNTFNQSKRLQGPHAGVTQFRSTGVLLWVGDGLSVIDNTFTGPGTMEGLFVEGVDLINVFAVADFNAFFLLIDAAGATGKETIEIRDNTISSYYLGLGVFSGGIIEDNEISDTLIGIQIGQEHPVWATAGVTAPLDITDNDILNNKRGIWVQSTNGEPVVINFNNIIGNTEDGIALYGGASNVVVSENEVSDSGRHGILLTMGASDNRVEENEVSNSGMDGIAVHAASNHNVVEGNEVSDSGRHGISVWWSSYNLIKENEVEESIGYDLFWDGVGEGNVWVDNEYETRNF